METLAPISDDAATRRELPAEVTVRWHAVETNPFLDALLECEPHVVARITESVRAGDILYRDGFVYWLASQAPPLPVRFVASFDPRVA
jgi:hypothetical protein